MKMDVTQIILILSLSFTFVSATHKDIPNSSEIFDVWPTEAVTDNDFEKRAKNQGWSGWSEWSTCSRSCDGGVAHQLRRCHSPQGCRGDPVRYKICNMQPCPESQDFRAHQCSAYDNVPYDGSLFKWTPHYDYSEPCALTCRGKPAHQPDDSVHTSDTKMSGVDDEPSVIVQLAGRVQDGTRCRPGSLDMCIQGKCQRVGCDLKIGSTKKVDGCGVCGGDGNSCTQPLYQWETTVMSLCSVTCGGGYKMARPICRNRVTGADADESLCSATTRPEPTVISCNTHLCPPKWITDDWSTCSKTCGGGIRDRLVICVEESNGVKNRIADESCHSVKPKSQESCNIQECPKWMASEWSGCSVSCGKGIQVRSVECIETDDGMRMSTRCEPHAKPMAVQTCTTGISCTNNQSENQERLSDEDLHPISYADEPYFPRTQLLIQRNSHEIVTPPPPPQAERLIGDEQIVPSEATYIKDSEWSPCSVTCGDGIRRRPYRCKIFLEFSRTVAKLNDSFCTGLKPTDEVERCFMEPCSMSYGYDPSYPRDSANRQLTDVKVQAAVPGKTYSWQEQGYTSCSASCLGGVEELIINCVRDDTGKVVSPFLCAPNSKPEARIRTCNDHQCPPRWNYSDYSACSKSCGIGIKTREVQCIHEVARGGENTMIVPNSMCPQPTPPDRQYCNVLDCPVRWEVSEWTKCSKSCGGGIKERRVECKQIMAQEHKVERPISMCPSAKPPDKKPCNTKPCAPEDQKPPIAASNTTYIQHDPKKNKVTLKIGGAATVFFGTQIKIKCPVKRFNRTRIRWSKDHNFLGKSKQFKISKKGALRILDVTYKDSGIYTCHASLSTADLRLTVKPKPGDFPSSEDFERHRDDADLNALRSQTKPDLQLPNFLGSLDGKALDTGQNSRPRSRELSKGRNKQKSNSNIQNPDSSIMEDEEPFRSRSQMTVSDLTTNSAASSGTRPNPMPQFHHFLASLQFLWPFQNFQKSRGHNFLTGNGQYYPMEMAMDTPSIRHHQQYRDEDIEQYNSFDLFGDADTVVLGPGSADNIKFEWMVTPWSECSQTCGTGNGIKYRKAHCMVKLYNSTHDVNNNFCEDADLQIPDTIENCGFIECPKWVTGDWTPCLLSKCSRWQTAIQKRNATCYFDNMKTTSDKCNGTEKPILKQECYNAKCKGKWQAGSWSECQSECDTLGKKFRTVRCVWYGTKKSAGNACQNLRRPPDMKICKGTPCPPDMKICNGPPCQSNSNSLFVTSNIFLILVCIKLTYLVIKEKLKD